MGENLTQRRLNQLKSGKAGFNQGCKVIFGIVQFYKKFIKDFSTLAKLLTNLLKK
jgi:hypothetical protein